MRTTIKRVWLLMAVSLSCSIASLSYGEDLAQIYALAKVNDPGHKALRHEFNAAGYGKDGALAGFLPTLNFEISNTDTRQNVISSQNTVYATGVADFNTRNETITLTQPLFRMASWRGYKQAEAREKQAVAGLAAADQDLIMRVTVAYLNVLAAQDEYAFTEAERDAVKRHLDLAEARYSSGLSVAASLHDARARHAVKNAELVVASNERDDMLQALQEMTGGAISAVLPISGAVPLDMPDPANIEQWIAMALQGSPLLEAKSQAAEAARQDMERQKAGHYPVVDLVASRNTRNTGGTLFGGGSKVRTDDIMVRLNLPIFAGGATAAQAGEAGSRYQVAQEELELERRKIERLVRAAYRDVSGGIGQVQAFAQSVQSQESARQLKFEGFKAGRDTMLAVLDAERDLYAAKRDYSRAQYDLVLNRLRLKQSVGTLSEADLQAVNGLVR